MTNTAHLFLSREAEPHRTTHEQSIQFADSRRSIPLLWWFFFQESSLTAKVVGKDSKLKVPYLVENWGISRVLFDEKWGLYSELLSELIPYERIAEFLNVPMVSPVDSLFLHLDGEEIFEGERSDFDNVSSILSLLDTRHPASQSHLTTLSRYSHALSDSLRQDERDDALVGTRCEVSDSILFGEITSEVFQRKREEILSLVRDSLVSRSFQMLFSHGTVHFSFCYRPFYRCRISFPPGVSSIPDEPGVGGKVEVRRSFLFIPFGKVLTAFYLLDMPATSVVDEIFSLLRIRKAR